MKAFLYCGSCPHLCDGTQILVWKRIKYGLMSDKEKQLLVSEVNIMRKLRHLNVVRYYDHIVDNVSADLYVITEHCENGDLGALIQLRKQQQYVHGIRGPQKGICVEEGESLISL